MLPAVVAGFALVVVVTVVETVVVAVLSVFVLGVNMATSELLVLVRSTDEFVDIRVTGDPRVPVEMKILTFCY